MPRPFLDDLSDAMGRLKSSGLPYETRMERAYAEVRDAWMAQNHLDALIAFVHHNWDSGNCDDFIAPLAAQLVERGDAQRYARLWKGIVRNRLEKFWAYRDPSLDVDEVTAVDASGFDPYDWAHYQDRRRATAWHYRYVLAGFDTYMAGLRRLGADDELALATMRRSDAAALRRPAPRAVRDRRRIDEALFWALIDDARAAAEGAPCFIEALQERLAAFAPAQILAFQRRLQKMMAALDHHDIWALAYISQGSCSDDGFADFRAWTVSRGRAVYEAVRGLDSAQPPATLLAPAFACGPAMLEEMQYVAARAYEVVAGEPMPPTGRTGTRTRGKPWREADLPRRYPALWATFGPGAAVPSSAD